MPSTHTQDDGGSGVIPPLPLSPPAVMTSSERHQTPEEWLLASAPSRAAAIAERDTTGAFWVRPGGRFGAVSIPAPVIHAAFGFSDVASSAQIAYTVQGPIFYNREGGRGAVYTALVWADVDQWWGLAGTVAHHPSSTLQVPAVEMTQPHAGKLWWVMPPEIPGVLCEADRLAQVVARGLAVCSTLNRLGGGPDE